MNPDELTTALKQRAAELGFSLCGVAPAVSPDGAARLSQWLAAGYAGQMHYIANRADAYRHPRSIMDGVRSLVMLAFDYRTAEPRPPAPGQGRISRYAWGSADYHDIIYDRLEKLAE